MPPRMVDDGELLARLTELFRADGYDGVSLSDLQEATGLKRSSLYHRFPGGKEEMAAAAVDGVLVHIDQYVLGPRHDVDRPVADRLADIAERLHEFYAAGSKSCLLETLSIKTAPDDVRVRVRSCADAFVGVLAGLAAEAGIDATSARERAVDVLAGIEGGLVVARATGDRGAFDRSIARLTNNLLGC